MRGAIAFAVFGVPACTLDTQGIGTPILPDADSDVDADSDSDSGTASPSDTESSSATDTVTLPADADLDGLTDDVDPCADTPNTLLVTGFDDWTALTGTWSFGLGADARGPGSGGYAWTGPCPGASCVDDWFVDVVVSKDGDWPLAFGVLGAMAWDPLSDFHCELLPADDWTMRLRAEPSAEAGASAPFADPPNRFAVRMIVNGNRQWCRGPRIADPILRTSLDERPAGAIGLFVFDGAIRFDSVRVWDLPAGCVVVPTSPPSP